MPKKTKKRKKRIATNEPLSEREVQVLGLICQERTPGEISKKLKISEKTFFNHRANMIAKIGARNNIGLYKYAIKKRIIRG